MWPCLLCVVPVHAAFRRGEDFFGAALRAAGFARDELAERRALPDFAVVLRVVVLAAVFRAGALAADLRTGAFFTAVFLAGAFLAGAFFVTLAFATVFFGAAFFGAEAFAGAFLAAVVFAAAFFTGALRTVFAAVFLAGDFRAVVVAFFAAAAGLRAVVRLAGAFFAAAGFFFVVTFFVAVLAMGFTFSLSPECVRIASNKIRMRNRERFVDKKNEIEIRKVATACFLLHKIYKTIHFRTRASASNASNIFIRDYFSGE